MSILAFVGRLGTGKTMSAIVEIEKRVGFVDCDVLVMSNIELQLAAPNVVVYQYATGLHWPEEVARMIFAIHRTGRYMGRDIRYIILLMDETGVLMNARKWASLSPSLLWIITESRHMSVDLVLTCHTPQQVDSSLRDLVDEFRDCRCFPAPSFFRRYYGKRPWFLWSQKYRGLEHFRKKGKGRHFSVLVYRRRYESLYSTDNIVIPPDVARDGGLSELLELAPVLSTGDSGAEGDGAGETGPSLESDVRNGRR